VDLADILDSLAVSTGAFEIGGYTGIDGSGGAMTSGTGIFMD
jgi:hypothetical protein